MLPLAFPECKTDAEEKAKPDWAQSTTAALIQDTIAICPPDGGGDPSMISVPPITLLHPQLPAEIQEAFSQDEQFIHEELDINVFNHIAKDEDTSEDGLVFAQDGLAQAMLEVDEEFLFSWRDQLNQPAEDSVASEDVLWTGLTEGLDTDK